MISLIFNSLKKNNRDVGPVIVGLELKKKKHLLSIKERMLESGFNFQYLNEKDPLLALLI